MAQSSEDQSATQETLRRWYLARLRKLALAKAGENELTPAALIHADRQAIEQLVVSRTERTDLRKLNHSKRLCLSERSVVLLVLIVVLLQFFAMVRFLAAGQVLDCMVSALAAVLSIGFGANHFFRTRRIEHSIKTLLDDDSSDERDSETLLSELSLALQRYRERERLIADFSSEVSLVITPEGAIKAISPGVLMSWGYHSTVLVGDTVQTLCSESHWRRLVQIFSQVEAVSDGMVVDSTLIRSDSSVIDVRWYLEWSETRRVIFALVEDITERKRIERMREEFVAIVSHDLRSPVTSFKHGLMLFADGNFATLTERGERLLASLESTAAHLLNVASDLLDLQRLDAHALELKYDRVRLLTVLESAANNVKYLATKHSVSLEIDADETTEIEVDVTRIERVVINLLTNAIKFSPKGSTVVLEGRCAAGCAHISVRDQGRGMNSSDLEKVFDRFQQAQIEDALLKGGTGLGLSICKAIAVAHKGSIHATSELGKGSVFVLVLPCLQQRIVSACDTAKSPLALHCEE